MKIAVCQMNVIPGNPRANGATIERIVRDTCKNTECKSPEMFVFPELAIPGYLIGDTWEEESFLRECKHVATKIRILAHELHVNIVVGNVSMTSERQHDGRIKKYNSLSVMRFSAKADADSTGEFYSDIYDDGFIAKTLLPNYREFDELRHFTPNTSTDAIRPIRIGSVTSLAINVGFALCEDGWDADYDIKVMPLLAKRGAEILINHSCSPFTVGKNGKRNRVFGEHAKNAKLPLIYVNAIGLQNNAKTIFSFDGCSVVYDNTGKPIYESPMFTEDVFVYDTTSIYGKVIYGKCNCICHQHTYIGDIYSALVYGIREYCAQSGIKNVVIGSSGGIDSAVSAALHVAALGKDHVYLVNMPSKYNSETTKGLSHKLAENLDVMYTTVPIWESIELTRSQINGLLFKNLNDPDELYETVYLSDFNMENVQARDRSSRILAAIASALPGGVFTNNGNKAECTVGYATLYGDVSGYLACIADLWKEDVYLLGKYINHLHGDEKIPYGIFSIVASAELSDQQNVDAGNGDPLVYWYHDRLFKSWIQTWNRKTPEDILAWYIEGSLALNLDFPKNEFGEYRDIKSVFSTHEDFINDLERWWNLFKGMGAAKRTQAPPVLAVTQRAFGFDYRDALNCVYFTSKYHELKSKLLMCN